MNAGTLWQRLWVGVQRCWHSEAWQAGLGTRDVWSLPVTDRFHAKQGRSTGRICWRWRGDELRLYLKRHLQLPRWRAWCATLWPGGNWSPATAEATRLDWARAQHFAVPNTVAAGEEIGPGCRLRSYLAVEELVGMREVNELLPIAAARLPAKQFRAWKDKLAHQIGVYVRRLHAGNRFHKDLYLCHCFTATSLDAEEKLLHLIDWQRLGWHPLTCLRWQIKDLAQLLYSSRLPEVSNADRLRFFRVYLGRTRLHWWDRVLLRLVIWKADRYGKHNQATVSQQPPLRRAS